jgi:uncharacterized membrane protein YoaK (UPF0700 family)
MDSISFRMPHKSASELVFNIFLPILFFLSVLRGLFLTDWVMGKTWSMPLHYLLLGSLLSVAAFVFYVYLPKIDADIIPVLAVVPVLMWLTADFRPLEEMLRAGILGGVTERTMGYLMAFPFSFVYVRYVQVSRTISGKICAAFFAFVFMLWGIAASILRENSIF